MEKDRHLEAYLDLCKRIFERMEREGSWPWANTPAKEDDLEE